MVVLGQVKVNELSMVELGQVKVKCEVEFVFKFILKLEEGVHAQVS